MYSKLPILALLLLVSSSAQAFFFPEFPFCPLGGPPGWANRIMHDDYYRYRHVRRPPAYYYSPYAAPAYLPAAYGMPPGNQCGAADNGSCPWRRR